MPRPNRDVQADIDHLDNSDSCNVLARAWSQAMLDTTPDLICLLDSDLVYRSANKAYAEAFGMQPQDLVDRKASEILPADIYENTLRTYLERCLQGERVDFDLWGETTNFGRRLWNNTYMPFKDEHGAIIGVLAHARDDTVRQQALDETRAKSQIIHDTLQSMDQGLLMLDDQGDVVLFNERLFHLTNLPRDFFDNHKTFDNVLTWWARYHSLDNAWLAKARERARRPDPLRFETPGPHGKILEVRHRPLKQGGFVRTYTDVTQRHEAQIALQQAHDQLEYLVEVRTKELEKAVADLEREVAQRKNTEQELRQARNAAESANAAKTLFLANMSHELRTPLNGVLGVGQLLLGAGLDPEQREYVEIMQQSSQELLRLLNDLLELASIEQGVTEPKFDVFSLRQALAPLLRTFDIQAHGRGLHFQHHIPDNIPDLLNGDVERIRQVLYNLLGNALKFTEHGNVSLQVRELHGPAREAAADKRGKSAMALLFSVKDTGIGIPEHQQERVFERFLLGEDFLTKRYGGSGIGLSIAKELVELMQGRMWMESESGKGSTFYFWLPLLPGDAAQHDDVTEALESAAAATETTDSRSWRILVVEDEPVNRLFIQRALQRMGYDILSAENGRRALELLAEEHVDLVLMDVQMPECNGLEATRRIRSGEVDSLPPDIPILGLTAYAMDSDREQGLEAGMDDYITKPCSLEDLREAIEAQLQPPELAR